MNKPEIILDGVTLPTPTKEGITITPNRLWSENAGRNTATGKFIGDIITVKYTVSIVYARLDEEQMNLFLGFTASLEPWHMLRFPAGSRFKTISCYIADVSYTMRKYDRNQKKAYYNGVTIKFIEQ